MHDHRPALHVRPHRSALLLGLVTLAHAGAIACVVSSPIPWPLALGLVAAVAALGVRGIRDHALRCAPGAIVELVVDDGAGWSVATRGGERLTVRPEAPWFVHPLLVSVRLRADSGVRHDLVLVPDAVDADVLRRLRVRLIAHRPRVPEEGRC